MEEDDQMEIWGSYMCIYVCVCVYVCVCMCVCVSAILQQM